MAGGIRSIFFPVIAVSNMDTALAYYRDLLGLRVTFNDYHEAAAMHALFGTTDPVVHSVIVSCPDGSEIEPVEFGRPRGTPASRLPGDPGLMAVNLMVHGIEELATRLSAAGNPPQSEIVPQVLPDGGRIKVLACRAPDDVALLLVELPPGRTSLAAPAPRP